MSEISDFRSDTVTRPTPEMRRAMAEALVGDDVLGDDPTVIRLEALAAETMGKDAGLFMPSGTMGNSVAVKVWTRELEEVIVGHQPDEAAIIEAWLRERRGRLRRGEQSERNPGRAGDRCLLRPAGRRG